MASVGNRTWFEKAKGGITRRSIKAGEVTPPKLHEDLFNGKYWRLSLAGQPILLTATGGAFATASDNQADVAILANGARLWYTQLAAATVLGPQLDATGLKVSLDDTAAEGAQYVLNSSTGGPLAMTVERTAGLTPDKGRFVRARFKLEDVSGAGSLAFGFRKVEAVQDNPQDYDEGAFFQVIVGAVNLVLILNTTAVVVDTTQAWADGETHELEVQVGGSGIVKFLFDGKEPTVNAALQFTDAEVIVPFFDYANEAGSTSDCHLIDLVAGTLEMVEK